jgi:hypothetical protein
MLQGPSPQLQELPSGQQISPRGDTAPNPCWYHRHYGARAQKCTELYAYGEQGKSTQQTLSAAYVSATTTGRLFLMDRLSKRQFQVDTGPASACIPAGYFRDGRNGSNATSVQLTAVLPTPRDGCFSASAWVYTEILCCGS